MSQIKLLTLIEWLERVRCLDKNTVGDDEMLRDDGDMIRWKKFVQV